MGDVGPPGHLPVALVGVFVLVALFCGAYFLHQLIVTYNGRDWLTWYDEERTLLPIMNYGVPVGALGLIGLAILAFRGKERLWKLLMAAAVIGVVVFLSLYRGSIASLRDPDWLLSDHIWWLRHEHTAAHNEVTAPDAASRFAFIVEHQCRGPGEFFRSAKRHMDYPLSR